MKNLLLILLFTCTAAIAQQKSKPVPYKYGKDGIEIISKNEKGTIIVSTFKAKPTIKDDIAQKVLAYHSKNIEVVNKTETFVGKEATVTGKYAVEKNGGLTSIKFIYEKVEWNNGLVEVSE